MTDDTEALRKVFKACEGTHMATAYLPAGTYLVSDTLRFAAWIYVQGKSLSDPEHPDAGASLNLRIVAYVPGPTPGYYVTWRARNGLFLDQDYFASVTAQLGGAWTTLQPANYQVVSTTSLAPGLSEVLIFVPSGSASFFRLQDGAQ